MQDKIVGRNSVLELLRRGNREIERILIAQGNNHPRLRQIRAIAEKNGIRCDFTPRRELDPIETDVPHQGVIALVSPASYIDLPSLITNTQNSESTALIHYARPGAGPSESRCNYPNSRCRQRRWANPPEG